MQTHDVGEPVRLTTSWYDATGAAANPSTIALTIWPPVGAPITKTKADMTQGATSDVWVYIQIGTVAGAWRWEAVGTIGSEPVEQSAVFLVGVGVLSGPCEPWTTWEEVEACNTTDFGALNPAQREAFIDTASALLYDLSGRKYPGICQRTRSLCLACRGCYPGWCSCNQGDRIDLGRNVWGAWDVIVDGVELDPSLYTVVDRRYLTRTDNQSWPHASDVRDPNSFRATWATGRTVPIGGRQAAALFAAEMGMSCLGLPCQLPQRVSTVNREGVTYTVIDGMKMIDEGRTGIYLVDLWLVADRQGSKRPAGIFAPGAHTTRRVH